MPDTLFTGRHIKFFERLDSTNNYAAKLLSSGNCTDGTVIVADEQSSGRGRRQSLWESKPGENLLCSVVYRPHFIAPAEAFLINMVAAVAVQRMLKSYQIKAQVKWPNDVLCSSEKICGILTETQIRGNQIGAAIIGIGLNINQTEFTAPRCTSMGLATTTTFDRNEVLMRLCTHLEAVYLVCRSNPTLVVNDYHEVLFGAHEWLEYVKNDQVVTSRLMQVFKDGTALFETPSGTERYTMDDLRLQRMMPS